MKVEILETMMIYLKDDGLSINHKGQYAAYDSDGNMKYFFGTDDSYLPKKITYRDTTTKNTSS